MQFKLQNNDYLEFYEDDSLKKEWRARTVAANGNILWVSSESYGSLKELEAATLRTQNILLEYRKSMPETFVVED